MRTCCRCNIKMVEGFDILVIFARSVLMFTANFLVIFFPPGLLRIVSF
jgi:hypothetical protein